MSSSSAGPPMLRPGEMLVHQGAANLHRGSKIGGWLHLTTQRLVFCANWSDVRDPPLEIELADIEGAELCWTRTLGIPLSPTSLAINLKNGERQRFVLDRRELWQEKIRAQLS
ncbi:MAG: hypothetical protein KC503_41615 [Myxococcales bacterium]|nr:hypothetical protein [Myxococcales bacterium]